MFLLPVVALVAGQSDDPAWDRAADIVSKMTLDEQFGLIQGNGHNAPAGHGSYVGVLPGVPRLGVPDLLMNDGPQGFRGNPGTSTQWPSGLTVAHSFDTRLMRQWGEAMGLEFSMKGANVQFGPGANLARIPNGGRSFEYLSGEDPFLGFTLVQPVVKGIQSQGVVANAKHYIQNNQEGLGPLGLGSRHSTSATVDERTQMEMYFPPFEGAVKAGVLSVMCGNNLVNGQYVCENNHTGNYVLREYGGFKGWMCSDYDGTRSTIDAANNGLDIAMPGPPGRPDYFGAPLRAAMASGLVSATTVADKATRVVYSLVKVGALDMNNTNSSANDVTSPAHVALARTLAAQSATLLQNTGGVLPLDAAKLSKKDGSVAIIGLAAQDGAIYGGGGSGAVTPKSPVSIVDGVMAKLGMTPPPLPPSVCTVVDKETDYFAGQGNSKGTALPAGHATADACCNACVQMSGYNYFTVHTNATSESGYNCWCHHSIKTKTSKTGFTSGTCAPGKPSPSPSGPVVYANGKNLAEALVAAAAADVVIVVISQSSHENADRVNLTLDQTDLVSNVASVANGKTVVVTVSPGPFLTPFRKEVAAILDLGMPGEQEGNAAADVLFGDVNPSGKMPHTMPNVWNEMQMAERQYPGIPPADPTKACQDAPTPMLPTGLNPTGGTGAADCEPTKAYYDEKLLVGYRWYAAHPEVEPAFAFGHGLSYTSFDFSNLQIYHGRANPGPTVAVDVTNNGSVAGAEVAQLYLEFPASAGEPPIQLKGFEKVTLAAGAKTTVTFDLEDRAFSIWDADLHAWSKVHGSFGVRVGASSRDVRLTGSTAI